MYQTTAKRFSNMNVPAFPMAGLLLFWGGTLNGFWAFGHNPSEYAKNITCPTLLLYGEKDNRVSRKEINTIYFNLSGEKKLKTYPLSGHENYLKKYKKEWSSDVSTFLKTY
jgi:esterase/lipase